MRRKIYRRPQARLDLISIWHYIARDNPDAADQLLDRINDVLQRLAARPLIGRERTELGDKLRSFPVGNYIVFYNPLSDGIDLIRVLSSYRDIDAATLEKKTP